MTRSARKLVLVSLLSFALPTRAQLSLPSPAWQPPSADSGAVSANSSSLPNEHWSSLLGDLLWFYEAQRSGNLPSSNRVSWRNSSALDDSPAGGYYDAGDYLKFTYPLSFTLTSICWGALNYGQGYESANQAAYLDAMLRWGLDWLSDAHPDNTTLIVQIGDANIDNNYWGGDQNIPSPRPSYQINATNPGTDAAAGASAAFTSCAALYASVHLLSPSSSSPSNLSTVLSPASSLANATYASSLLAHGVALYNFANTTSPSQRVYQDSVPQVTDSYASSGYEDDLVLAGLFLALCSLSSVSTNGGGGTYYADAKALWQQKFQAAGNTQGEVLNWDSKSPMLAVLGAQMASAYGSGTNATTIGVQDGDLSMWTSAAETYLDDIVNNGKLTKGGLIWFEGDSDAASLNPALNAAMLITQYLPLVNDSSRAQSYSNFAASQLNYALGNNPMSMPYVVGVNPNSPANPHSAMASGGNDIGNIDGDPANETYILYGAVVGGPNKHDKFWDIRSDYPQTEIALDYNAPLLTLSAASILTLASDPYYVQLQAGAYDSNRPGGQPCDSAIKGGCGSKGLSEGAKIAIGVTVSVVGLAIGLGIAYLLWSASRK